MYQTISLQDSDSLRLDHRLCHVVVGFGGLLTIIRNCSDIKADTTST